MITREEVRAILMRAMEPPDAETARREGISNGTVIDIGAGRERKSPDGDSIPLITYPTDHPVMLVRTRQLSRGKLRLLSEAMHDGWASQALLDDLDETIGFLEHVEDVLQRQVTSP